MEIPSEILAYYERGGEVQRFANGTGQLEFSRTQELISRFLQPTPAQIIDIGGGPGHYAGWLAGLGYQVHLVDISPLHIEQAKKFFQHNPECLLASASVGDARHLDFAENSMDAALLMGPLYHLTKFEDRVAALFEACRVLKPGGILFAAVISRFASALDGLRKGYLTDPDYRTLVEEDLRNGQHRNPYADRDYFTTAYFHHPNTISVEVEAGGLKVEKILAIEGPGWFFPDFDAVWQNPQKKENILRVARWLEEEPSLIGFSSHIMIVAKKAA